MAVDITKKKTDGKKYSVYVADGFFVGRGQNFLPDERTKRFRMTDPVR